MDMDIDLLTLAEVKEITKRSSSSIYLDMKLGLFPRPIKIGRRAVRWRREDVYAMYKQWSDNDAL